MDQISRFIVDYQSVTVQDVLLSCIKSKRLIELSEHFQIYFDSVENTRQGRFQ